MTALGLLAFGFYLAHGGPHLWRGEWFHLLWTCHLASLAIGLGLVFRRPAWNAVGVLWLALGVPLWLLDLSAGGEFSATSLLTHVGGLALGIVGARRLGWPRHAWWRAVAALAALQLFCRWTTPAEPNVNLSQRVWTGWEDWFPSYFVYEAVLLAIASAVFALAGLGLGRWAPPAGRTDDGRARP